MIVRRTLLLAPACSGMISSVYRLRIHPGSSFMIHLRQWLRPWLTFDTVAANPSFTGKKSYVALYDPDRIAV
jgi:hypothetical protein